MCHTAACTIAHINPGLDSQKAKFSVSNVTDQNNSSLDTGYGACGTQPLWISLCFSILYAPMLHHVWLLFARRCPMCVSTHGGLGNLNKGMLDNTRSRDCLL